MGKAPVLVVANPRSGGGLAGELVPHLARDLARLGYPVDMFQSAEAGQIIQRVRDLRGSWAAIAVVGGDGTVREVLQGEPGLELPVAVLPAGTANVLAAEFHLPKSPRDTATMIEAGRTRIVDTAVMRRDGRPDEPFLLFVGAGADGRIVHRVHERRGPGTLSKLRYLRPILGEIFHYAAVPHWFVLENGERHGPFEQILVTNVTSYGGMWKLPGGITVDDGLLDCLGFRARTGKQILKHGVLGSLNRLREGPDLLHLQVARVRVEAEAESPIQIDGDPGGVCPFAVETRPGSLRLLVPEGGQR